MILLTPSRVMPYSHHNQGSAAQTPDTSNAERISYALPLPSHPYPPLAALPGHPSQSPALDWGCAVSTTAEKATLRTESLAMLRKWLKPGDTVYTILRHVSKSGMCRDIGMVILTPEGPLHPNYAIAEALGLSRHGDAVRIKGCGMDMGFDIVHSLAQVLFKDGTALKHSWL